MMIRFVSYTAVLGMLASCRIATIPFPQVPECTALSRGMICDFPRGYPSPSNCFQSNPDRPQEYECPSIPRGWQLTSPKGYEVLRKDVEDKYFELAKLRRRFKR